MFSPARLMQLVVELIFLLLGVLVFWLGMNGRIYFDRRSVPWVVTSAGIAAWGLLALGKPGPWSERWQKRNRGASLLLLGILMLAITRVPFRLVSELLTFSGLVLLLRGVFGSLLILKPR